MSFMIVVDSCCDLPAALAHSPYFCKVPLTIQVGEQVFTDNASFDQSKLLWAMKQDPEAPKTSCPSPAAYLEAFNCGADDIYVVTLSALLSGSHNSAAQARLMYLEEHPKANVHIFNSCSASSGEVLAAMKIMELARSGLDFHTVVQQTSAYIGQMDTMFVLETLDNLRKNGRLTRLQSIVTGTLRIKLLMGSTPEGEICKRGQALSMKQALTKMAEVMAKADRQEERTLCITHCNCLERAFMLKEMALKNCRFKDILLTETGGISTVYANDGGIIAAY
ncbi:DegV family protein [Pseudoflavonifractor sp. MSJ-37]|nr:DegV family protein [Pseudoflavonifractor sp. MSJ-37]